MKKKSDEITLHSSEELKTDGLKVFENDIPPNFSKMITTTRGHIEGIVYCIPESNYRIYLHIML